MKTISSIQIKEQINEALKAVALEPAAITQHQKDVLFCCHPSVIKSC